MTFAELIAETFRRIGESQTTPVYWSLADVKDALNEGYLDFCEQTRCYEREAEVECVSRVSLMDLRTAFPYPVLGIRRLYGRDFNAPLVPTTVKALDDRDNRWEMARGVVRRYFVRGLYWLGLYPVPDGRQKFRVSITSLPDRMVEDADEPQIPIQCHEALIHYAVYDLKIQEDEMAEAMRSWEDYLKLLAVGVKYVGDQIRTPRTFIMGDGGRQGTGMAGWRY